MIKVLSVVGARPNFIKIGALHRAFEANPDLTSRIVHTGQHYDAKMSDVFFRQLELPEPDIYLGIGSGSHARQTADVMTAFEEVVLREQPDVVVVVGDVNSTVAAALVASKLHVPLVHVEAGLRSFDRRMPEEINRLATDAISDLLYVSEQSGLDNLHREGVPEEKVYFAGNVMIDSLVHFREKARALATAEEYGLEEGRYILTTLHRPSNVDSSENLLRIAELLAELQELATVVFPVHPRTRARLGSEGLLDRLDRLPNLRLTEPLGYLEFLNLMMHAGLLVTDSGGIQEETTFLRIPCITIRENTERPVTVDLGTNILLPLDQEEIVAAARRAMTGDWKEGTIPPLWDGKAATRIADHLAAYLSSRRSPQPV